MLAVLQTFRRSLLSPSSRQSDYLRPLRIRDMHYKYKQLSLGSHFALKMEIVRKYETSAIQSAFTQYHQPETGPTLTLNRRESLKSSVPLTFILYCPLVYT